MNIFKCIMAMIALVLIAPVYAVPPNYNGNSQTGGVTVSDDRNSMTGSFGVRYRPTPNNYYSYIKIGTDGFFIRIYGYDSDHGRPFFCWRPIERNGTIPWDAYLEMVLSASNGTTLSVSRVSPPSPSIGNLCASFGIDKSTLHMH